jgi:hypothetical protein
VIAQHADPRRRAQVAVGEDPQRRRGLADQVHAAPLRADGAEGAREDRDADAGVDGVADIPRRAGFLMGTRYLIHDRPAIDDHARPVISRSRPYRPGIACGSD